MDAQQFLAEFENIISAPDGLQRIRELVLQLAISGGLTQRIHGDTPASALFAQNQAAQAVLISKKGMKPQHATAAISIKDTPWTLPEGWIWCRLGQVTNYGQAPKSYYTDVDADTWVLELEDIEKGSSKLIQRVRARNRKFKSTKNGFPNGAVLYGKLRPYLDKVLIADEPGVCTTEICPISFFDGIDTAYLRWYLKSPYFIAYASNSTHGMNLPRMGTNEAREALFPFPPQQEQVLIVAKVDELMALCDKLEALQQSQQQLKKLVRTATLGAFVVSTKPNELKQSWLRLQNSLLFWGDDEQGPFELRNAIGAVACRGLLTDPVVIQPITFDESLPPLPEGWSWRTLGELSTYITSGSRGWKQYMASTGDIFIRSQDIKHDAVILEDPAYVILPEKAEGKRTIVQPGDLLLTITGGNVGKCAQVPVLPKHAYVSQHVALIRIKDPANTPFIHHWMTNTYGGRKFLGRYIYGDKPGLNLTQVASVPVPMPPKEIQTQIMARLERYAVICLRLLQQVREARETAKRLAAAAVASITGIRREEEEDLKVPKTELISKLRIGLNPTVKEQAPLAVILARQNGEMAAKDLWQRFGGEIDAFYAQLKLEVGRGWILEPVVAEMREVEVEVG